MPPTYTRAETRPGVQVGFWNGIAKVAQDGRGETGGRGGPGEGRCLSPLRASVAGTDAEPTTPVAVALELLWEAQVAKAYLGVRWVMADGNYNCCPFVEGCRRRTCMPWAGCTVTSCCATPTPDHIHGGSAGASSSTVALTGTRRRAWTAPHGPKRVWTCTTDPAQPRLAMLAVGGLCPATRGRPDRGGGDVAIQQRHEADAYMPSPPLSGALPDQVRFSGRQAVPHPVELSELRTSQAALPLQTGVRDLFLDAPAGAGGPGPAPRPLFTAPNQAQPSRAGDKA